MALPDFLLIGAPKAGTTALHVALARHPEIFMSQIKEPKYFLTADTPPPTTGGPGDAKTFSEQIWRRSDYEKLFAAAPMGTLKGESTTLYLRDKASHQRIHDLMPDAKLIAILRDPVDRAHSNWTHLRSAGLEPDADFLHACSREDERAAKGWAPFWRYLEQSLYGDQLDHLLTLFPREQVLVLIYRDYREYPQRTLDEVCRFLGIEAGVVSDVTVENLTVATSPSKFNDLLHRVIRGADRFGGPLTPVGDLVKLPASKLLQREQRARLPLTEDERTALLPYFDADVARLEQLLDRDLSHWRAVHKSGRPDLAAQGRFGTAYKSIDRPTR